MHTDARGPALRSSSTAGTYSELRALSAGGAIGWLAGGRGAGLLGSCRRVRVDRRCRRRPELERRGPERRGPGFWQRIKLRERERGRESARNGESADEARGEGEENTQSGGERAGQRAGREGQRAGRETGSRHLGSPFNLGTLLLSRLGPVG